MKLLRSPFKYKATCGSCKSEVTFKDEDICKHSYYGHKEVLFVLTDEIKDSITKNATNPKILDYLKDAQKVQLVYSLLTPRVTCPYCGGEISIKTNSGKLNGIITSYYLLSSYGSKLIMASEFSSTALYIMYEKKLIPEHLNL